MSESLTGWALLLSPLDPQYLKPIHESVYRKKGLTDVNDGHLWERLHNSGFPFSIDVLASSYHGTQERKGKNGPYTVHLATATVRITIWDAGRDALPRTFTGAGAHENMSFDASVKGAATSATGQAYKYMGQTMQLYKQGQINDLIYAVEQAESAPAEPAAAPAPTEVQVPDLTPDQKDVFTILLAHIPEENRKQAKDFTMERMKAAAVRKADTFEAGYNALIAIHSKICGKRCAHQVAVETKHPELLGAEQKAA